MKKDTIVIIWGTSPFWQLWKRYFESKWHEVIVSTNNTEIKPKDAVKKWDIIIVSVPIRYTINVLKELIPFIWNDKLLIDFTGIKIDVSKELINYTKGEVVSIHPMFWPWVKSIKDHNISYDPIKTGVKWEYIYKMFAHDWAKLIELESRKHDELVSVVQSSVHIMNLMLWHILKERGINIDDIMKISTPNSRMQLCILARFLNQNACLYTDMQMFNSLYKDEILQDIKKYFNFVDNLIENKKINEFENEFNEIKNYFWDEKLKNAFKITEKIDSELRNNI